MNKMILILATLAISMIACATDKEAPETAESPVVITGVQQELVLPPGFCESHQALCTQLCSHLPFFCDTICENYPELEICDDAPQCVDLGDPCLDEEEPGFVPCCGEENGTAGCFLDQETGERTCRAISSCEGPSSGQECLPEGPACCPDPNGAPTACEATDPSDPNSSFVCTPA